MSVNRMRRLRSGRTFGAPKLGWSSTSLIPGQQNPRRGEGRRRLAQAVHAHAVESHRLRIRRDHRLQIDVSVRDVDGEMESSLIRCFA